MDEKMIELLLYSLDNELTKAEQEQLDTALANSAALRAERDALLEMRNALANFSVDEDATFTDDLMQRIQIEKRNVPIQSNIRKLFPRVAAACILLVLLSVVAIYMTEGNLSIEAIVGVQDLSPEDAYSYLDY